MSVENKEWIDLDEQDPELAFVKAPPFAFHMTEVGKELEDEEMEENKRKIKKKKNPLNILVCTPSYTHRSGGIRCLHYLVHLINLLGHNGFYYDFGFPNWRKNYEWEGQLWNGEKIDFTVYAENHNLKLNKSQSVRWCLNSPGLFGGDDHYPKDEIVFYHGDEFKDKTKKATKSKIRKFFLPNIEPDLYNYEKKKDLEGSYYIGKGTRTMELPKESELFEITRGEPALKEDVIDILKRSKNFYSFDDLSTILQEAVLCGCNTYIVTDKIRDYTTDLKKYLMDEKTDMKATEKFINEVMKIMKKK